MKVMVTAQGSDLEAPSNPRFGRCPMFVFVDIETMAFEAIPNPAASASGGAGIQAAQFVVEQGAEAVLTGNVGPNAAEVLRAADVPVYLNNERTIKASVEAFKEGRLAKAQGATVAAHTGMGGRSARFARRANPTAGARDEEIETLKKMAADLRRQLADIVDRIEDLEKEV
jgi:predicted Fe-Mo cluster-binding NifX family protein